MKGMAGTLTEVVCDDVSRRLESNYSRLADFFHAYARVTGWKGVGWINCSVPILYEVAELEVGN